MARDRKRAKQRRQRQQASQPRLHRVPEPGHRTEPGETAMPDPLDHASAEVEIAEAAEAGVETEDQPGDHPTDGAIYADEVEPDEIEPDEVDEIEPDESAADASEALGRPVRRERPAARPERGGNRLVNFLRASWRELQRVQWPNRQQVAQATGVVLGFVVIAGGYLGLLDALWSRVVNAIL
jgi:preprotein translocase subunit SecE